MLDILFVLTSKLLLMLFWDETVEKSRLNLPSDAQINGTGRLKDNSRRLSTLGMHNTLAAREFPRLSPLKRVANRQLAVIHVRSKFSSWVSSERLGLTSALDDEVEFSQLGRR